MTSRPHRASRCTSLSDAVEAALAQLRPDELDAVELVERLALYPRLGIPVPGGTDPEVDDYTARISLVHRVHDSMQAVFVTWVIAGP
ncbi:hypothetical protein ACFYST_19770 [Kitasatospora sp. NPDC004614]|uniref:hypothetical protein n=1 Tax=unclassified Kitasatospora TaxID=2633591 RepID=UPI0036B7E46F